MSSSSFWKNKKVFITGANGFLGSHLTKKLVAMGVRPCVLIYEENPNSIFDVEKLALKSKIIRGDIRNLDLVRQILADNKIEIIFHLAAQAIVDYAVDNPLETFEINIGGTWNILEASAKTKSIKKIIVASSDKAYGHHEKLPYQEHLAHLKGVYPYEVSKTCVDLISQSYYRTFQLPVCITRATNLYGPGDLKFNRIVPRTIEKLYKNEPPIIRDSKNSLRDYLYVEDAADAYIALAEKMNPKIFGHAFNFSTNQPLSVGRVIKIISRELNKKIRPVIIKTAGLEIKNQYASFEKAKKILKWQPKHTFIEGIKKTIRWYFDYFNKIEAPEKGMNEIIPRLVCTRRRYNKNRQRIS